MTSKAFKNRKPRGSKQRKPTKLSTDIPKSMLKWLRDFGAGNPQIEIYWFILFENKAGRIVKNTQVAEACKMHRQTVKWHIKKLIDLGLLDRNDAHQYTALLKA